MNPPDLAAGTTTAEWITAWGTLGTAVLALVGVVLSMLTAKSARQETRQAHEALGMVGKPKMSGRVAHTSTPEAGPHYTTSVWNVAERPAVDVVAEVTLRDGSTWRGHAERLEQNNRGDQAAVRDPHLRIFCGPLIEGEPGDGVHVEQIQVRYRDEHELLRWEYTRRKILKVETRDSNRLSSERVEETDVRLDRRRGNRWVPRPRS